jgi:Fe-S-cluster containining protein
MKGTCKPKPRCESLEGVIGETVGCAIYEQRSSPCREFDASWVYDEHNPRCDTARAAHGLPPLTPDDHLTTLIAVQDITHHASGA